MPAALILGIAGQDGSYLAELLLEKGSQVVVKRPDFSLGNNSRVRHLIYKICIMQDGLLNQEHLEKTFGDNQPDDYVLATGEVHISRIHVDHVKGGCSTTRTSVTAPWRSSRS